VAFFFNVKLRREKLTSSQQRWQRLREQRQPVQLRRKQRLLVRELLQVRELLRVRERVQVQALLPSYHKRPERRQR
jgi:hypothetical protein